MKKIKQFIILCVSLILCFSLSMPVYAQYDGKRYEHVDDTWYVTDYHGSPCSVILYTFIQNKYAFPGTGHSFTFSCNEAEFSTGVTMATMEYFYYSDEPIEELDSGKIFYGDFGLEPGKYTFVGGTNHTVLCFDSSISAINLPTPEDYKKYEEANTVTVNSGDTLYIFALNGDYEWRKEVYTEFYDWAIEKKGQHENYFTSTVIPEDDETLNEKEKLEPYYEIQDDGFHLYCTYDNKDNLVKLKEECTYNTGVCIYCNNIKPALEEEIEVIIPELEQPKPVIQDYLIIIVGVFILIGLYIIAKIRKR